MSYYDEQLLELQKQIARKKRLESELKDLHKQQKELAAKVRELEKQKMSEQADVDRLEGRSLTAFFYNVVGKMDEKLDQERKEAYAAAVKYDVAANELSAVEYDIQRYEAELQKLQGCELRYERTLQRKLEAVKTSGIPEATEIIQLEEHIAFLENQKIELNEAINAGRSALSTTERILSSLDSAEGWGTWDLLGGGGIITHMAKHGHLDDAQSLVEELQVKLRRFKTELADVQINAEMQVNIDGFLLFADYFFDGLFADWAVLDKINESMTQVQKTKSQISSVINKLNGIMSSINREQEQSKVKLNALVLHVSLQ